MLTKVSSIVAEIDLQPPAVLPIYADWAEVVGDSIFEHTTSLKVRSAILEVAVDSPTWAHQLLHRQPTIVKGMQALGYHQLSSLSIRVMVRTKESQTQPVRKPELQRHRPVTSEMKELFDKCAATANSLNLKVAYQKLGRLTRTE